MRKVRALLLVALFPVALAAPGCGGAAGTGFTAAPPTGGGTLSVQTQEESSVAAVVAAGEPAEAISTVETAITDPIEAPVLGIQTASVTPAASTITVSPNDTCVPNFFGSGPYQGFKYYKPDKAGDPNSVQYQFFYDLACTQIARDHVRIVSALSGTGLIKTQTHTVTISDYDKGNAAPVSVGVEATTINGQFNSEGYPILKDGFTRSSFHTLSKGGVVVVNRNSEFVSSPSTGTSTTYCGDSAGYSTAVLTATARSHGSQNLLAAGSRTVNADGSVTWTSSSSGSAFSATPPATFTLNKGTLNSACPIGTPAFTLTGGALLSSYSIPSMSATYKSGSLINLTVTNETLANGFTLNITTNTSVSPTSPTFINGTIANAGKTIATFSVDAKGNGTLTVTATGTVYTMTHWHVVKG